MLYFVLALCARLNRINKTNGYVQTMYTERGFQFPRYCHVCDVNYAAV